MAKINEIELKAFKDNIGHDQLGVQANIYFKNKKVGYVFDDGWGGPLNVHIDKDKREKVIKAVEEGYKFIPKNWKEETLEHFFNFLIELTQDERYFKSSIKKGFQIVMHLDFFKRDKNGYIDIKAENPRSFPMTVALKHEGLIKEVLEEEKPEYYRIYKSLDDFIYE